MNSSPSCLIHIDKFRWTPEETAGFLRISIPALYQMVYRREIPHLKVGRRLRFEERRLRDWLREKEVQA